MPSEPDNTKMEELLKAYARKRRDAEGAPLNMHPATRRMLQDEVARVYPKRQPADGYSWPRLLFQFWPRIAFAMCIVVVLGGTIWMLNRPAQEGQAISFAKNENVTPRPADSASGKLSEYDEPAALPQPAPSKRGFALAEKETLPMQKPGQPAPPPATSAPTPATTPVPAVKLREEVQLTREERVSQQSATEKQKVDDLAAVPDRDLGYGGGRPAAPPSPTKIAPKAVEEKLADAKGKESADKPALRGDLAANDSKGGKDVSQALDGITVTEQNGKPLTLAKSLATKEEPAKKESSLSVASAARQPQATSGAAGMGGSQATVPQSMDLSFGAVTTWTNTAYAQNWSFQDARNQLGRQAQFGEGLASATPRFAPTKPATDRDGDVVGGFGNVGGDGRYARFRAQDSVAAPAAVNGPAAAGGAQASDNYGVAANPNLFAGAKSDTSAVQQNGQLAGFGRSTNPATTYYYAQRNLGVVPKAGNANTNSAGGNRVLEHFQLVQNGETLRIVDADGSVYEGKMLAAGEALNLRLLDRNEVDNRRGTEAEEKLKRSGGAPLQVQPAEFKLTGVNRTLGQLVVVTGHLDRRPLTVLYDSDSLDYQAPNEATRRNLQPSGNTTLQSAAKASLATATNTTVRMSGVAVVGGTNQIRLEAIPLHR